MMKNNMDKKADIIANLKHAAGMRYDELHAALEEMKLYKDVQALCGEGSLIMDAEKCTNVYKLGGVRGYMHVPSGSARAKDVICVK